MSLTPEQTLLRTEARAARRAADTPARQRSAARKALETAFTAYVAEHGMHAAGAWASAKAGPLMAHAHPRGAAETAMRARAEHHFRKVPHVQEG